MISSSHSTFIASSHCSLVLHRIAILGALPSLPACLSPCAREVKDASTMLDTTASSAIPSAVVYMSLCSSSCSTASLRAALISLAGTKVPPARAETSRWRRRRPVPPSNPMDLRRLSSSSPLLVASCSTDIVVPLPTLPSWSSAIIVSCFPSSPETLMLTPAALSDAPSAPPPCPPLSPPPLTSASSFLSTAASLVFHTRSPRPTLLSSSAFFPNLTRKDPEVTSSFDVLATDRPRESITSYTEPPSSFSSGAPLSNTTPSPRLMGPQTLIRTPPSSTPSTFPTRIPRCRGFLPLTSR
mmetsp:Transcript_46032/g.144385  ORF Transcript_46032/g.144385 Transcript_46032/m.144385 type:complete len:298 (-) Transcript_46032:1368-2261(-)